MAEHWVLVLFYLYVLVIYLFYLGRHVVKSDK